MLEKRKYSRRDPGTLDERDMRVIALLISGAPAKEISAAIGMTRTNASIILFRIRKRFGAANNVQLVVMLFRRGILR